MGCSQSARNVEPEEDNILRVMFKKFDKEGKGYISRENLEKMMKDDKTHIKGNDVDHILSKFGSDGNCIYRQLAKWMN
jgi:Ca2+-binding EF-hand superfamily protein